MIVDKINDYRCLNSGFDRSLEKDYQVHFNKHLCSNNCSYFKYDDGIKKKKCELGYYRQ